MVGRGAGVGRIRIGMLGQTTSRPVSTCFVMHVKERRSKKKEILRMYYSTVAYLVRSFVTVKLWTERCDRLVGDVTYHTCCGNNSISFRMMVPLPTPLGPATTTASTLERYGTVRYGMSKPARFAQTQKKITWVRRGRHDHV